ALVKYLMELGVFGAVGGLLSCGIAKWILVPCGWILWGYEKLCRFFVELPGAQYITGKPDMWQMITYYTGLAAVLFVLYRKLQLAEVQLAKEQYGKQRLTGALYIFVPFAMLFLVLVWPQKKSFEIDFLDVGQGDGIYLCTGDGVAMFVDGGSTDVKNVGQYRILPFLKAKGVRKISCWFVSHTDADHISGLEEVLASGYPVERLIFAEAVKSKEKTKSLAKLAEKAGTIVQYMEADEKLYSKNAVVRCLYPQVTVQSEDINEQCLVFCYEEGGVKALFAGDISSDIEKKILEKNGVEHVQIYKANHHGSRFSNGEEWMQALCPKITVASAGKNNRYGHPSREACERIRASESAFYCTTEYGRLRVRIVDGKLVCDGYVTAP
uniref:ComEC/Rec2 family competence protein n=1 Tax=Agathobacter sp. TaxID=2021311 RepID=UPI00402A36AB